MKLSHFVRALLFLHFFAAAFAQTPADVRARTASISGRVTIGGAPAINALVTIEEMRRETTERTPAAGGAIRPRIFVRARTNGEGRYRATGLAEGAYDVRALSRAFVAAPTGFDHEPAREITLDAGEARENVDFTFVRGGVITGRVTDAEGRPLIAASLQLLPVGETGELRQDFPIHISNNQESDDRGVYRLFGLRAGRYLVGVTPELWYMPGSGRVPMTFHPETTDRARAKVVELREGETIEGIDIRLAPARKTYEALGRVIDAETGRPIPGQRVTSGGVTGDSDIGPPTPPQSAISDEQGRFKLTGLISGEYRLQLEEEWGERGEYYNEAASFTVADDNVNGLEIKAIRGATVSGVVAVAGGPDAAARPSLRKIMLNAIIWAPQAGTSDGDSRAVAGHAVGEVNADGSFRISGLVPGRLSLRLLDMGRRLYSISRIERDGAPVEQQIEIHRQEQINNLRIWVEPATGVIRGQVKIAGGALPQNMRLHARASRKGDPVRPEAERPFFSYPHRESSVDEKGRFLIDGLTAGEYEMSLKLFLKTSAGRGESMEDVAESRLTVFVSAGGEASATLSFDPARRK